MGVDFRKSGSVKSEYKNYPVEYSSGRSSIRVRKGRAACPEFWAKADAAEAEGLRYCGYGNHAVPVADIFAAYICRECYRARLVGHSDYCPPKRRQTYADICPRTTTAEIVAAVARVHQAHRTLWDEYSAVDATRAEARDERDRRRSEFRVWLLEALLARRPRLGDVDAAREIPGATPAEAAEARQAAGSVGCTNSSENGDPVTTTTDVEVDPYAMYDEQTRARLNALRNQLNGD